MRDFVKDILPKLKQVNPEIFKIIHQSNVAELKIHDFDENGKIKWRETNFHLDRSTFRRLIFDYVSLNSINGPKFHLPTIDSLITESKTHKITIYDKDQRGKQKIREVINVVCRPTLAVLIQEYLYPQLS